MNFAEASFNLWLYPQHDLTSVENQGVMAVVISTRHDFTLYFCIHFLVNQQINVFVYCIQFKKV